MTEKEKMTAPIASVGADVEQSSSNKLTNQSIADLPGKGNLQATNNAENIAKSATSICTGYICWRDGNITSYNWKKRIY